MPDNLVSNEEQGSTTSPLPSRIYHVFCTVRKTTFRECSVVLVEGYLTYRYSMEFVKLEPFNAIPFRSLTADQTGEMIKVAAKPPPQRAEMSR